MHAIFTALVTIAKNIGNAIKKAFLILLRPIARFLFLLLKGIYTILKYCVFYIFVKPILFLYHHVVVPIGKGLKFLFTKLYKYLILPPLKGLTFIIKKIGRFFKLMYDKILTPIGHVFLIIFKAIGSGICFVFKKIAYFIAKIAKFIFYKIIKPIWQSIVFVLKKIGFAIQWCCLKVYIFFKIIFLFIYNKILYPIFYGLYIVLKYIFLFFKFIFEKLFYGLQWFFKKIFWVILSVLKFIYNKILKPIGLFIYRYILKPIGCFFKFIFTKIYVFLLWLTEKIIQGFKILGKWAWKTIKFIYQCISVTIVVSISGLLCMVYTFLVYPVRIIIENKTVADKKEIPLLKRVIFHPYYLFLAIKESNLKHYTNFKEKHPDIAIFIQIKNVVAVVPSILYSVLFYPLNFFLILILNS